MPRYVTKSIRAGDWIWQEETKIQYISTVSDHIVKETGLLDKDGQKLYRFPNPMGFGRDDQW